jgi:hypothetical protein
MNLRRPALACGLAALALLLGGCVYLRLLELKWQLDKFDRNFAVATTDGLAIVFHHPVMRPGDVRWFGAKPERIEKLGQAEHWHLRLVKQLPPGVSEPVKYDIILELSFANDRLTRVAVPEAYFAAIPKQFVVGVIRSLGRSRIDQDEKKIEATVAGDETAFSRPRLATIDRLLGLPSEVRVEGPHTVRRYRFVPTTTEPDPAAYDFTMTFDTATGDLRRWHSRTPVGGIGFKFDPPPAPARPPS